MTRLVDADKLVWSIPPEESVARCIVANAPTVEAPIWIPVKERLPEDTEDEFNCFITVISSILNRFIMEAHYVNCLEEWSKEYAGERRGAWMAWDREDCEFFEVDNVIAWMPMIKPYREDEQCD